jgi:hypothetical protein
VVVKAHDLVAVKGKLKGLLKVVEKAMYSEVEMV